jgi:phosphoribosyl 1,2-cyclic phosphate phosphodiesterase
MIELTFLGTGTSNGVPMIGCHCPVCTSSDPRDKRSRTSAVIRTNGKTLLIDAATELRTQAIANGLEHVDAILFTHPHADHTGGFDDLRRFNELQKEHLPVFTGPETAEILRARFAYGFEDVFPFYGGKPDLLLNVVDGPFQAVGVDVTPIPVWHGQMPVNGYRFGDLAYVTDAKVIPDSSLDLMRGLDVLVINALRERPHPTHLSFADAIAITAEVKPRVAYLIHLSHETSHVDASALLPEGMFIAYDGLVVETRP